MEEISKYFTKTTVALEELKKTTSQLTAGEENAQTSITAKTAQCLALQKVMNEQVERIDNIINNLNGALK